ncbi:carboxymuconolactone decarboxylase family protein [Chitinophaga polysaccharea]|uniref:carboxymuconolactone decarboxylase family protein n=1 Tax=Chitinophaga polysaccharea TaxID=1293035 RepID=UPI00163CC4D5|nr:hypothetical protein [Chitinophaga polysaccharea]
MRLQKVTKGDGLFRALLIRFISGVSGMRLPDAARIVMYHRDYYGKPMTAWTHAAMRGESGWSVGERELFAAMTAKWNQCPFCIDAHGAIASLVLDKTLVTAALSNYHNAALSSKLYTTLQFLETFAKTPGELTTEQVKEVLLSGVSTQELEDAMAVVALFSITVRCANALRFEMLSAADQAGAAKRMLQQGYVFGKGIPKGRPDHKAMALKLHKCIFEGPGLTDTDLRQAVGNRATGGPALPVPAYDKLALEIGAGSYRVTDEQVNEAVKVAGSEKAAFELITAAAVATGLSRWQSGSALLEEVKK